MDNWYSGPLFVSLWSTDWVQGFQSRHSVQTPPGQMKQDMEVIAVELAFKWWWWALGLCQHSAHVCMLSQFNHVWLSGTLWMAACPCGFSRQEYWSGLPCPTPGDLLDPGIEPRSLMSTCICRQVLLPLVLLGKLHVSTPGLHNYFIYIYIYCLIYEIILFKKYFLILSKNSK